MIVGKISGIWRFPVKSMGGESMDAARITHHGLWGDRARALVDPTENRVASAKQFDRFPGLLDFTAQYVRGEGQSAELPPVDVRFPDGRIVRSGSEGFDESLSQWFGRPTSISSVNDDPSQRPQAGKYAMPDTYFDYAPLHLLTDVAMASVAHHSPGSLVALERFRPNLLIQSFESGDFPENNWIGKKIRIGADVLLQLTDPCPRCAVPTLAQHNLPKDAKLLKKIAATNTVHVPALQTDQPCLGAYAFVLRGGMVSLGDEISLD